MPDLTATPAPSATSPLGHSATSSIAHSPLPSAHAAIFAGVTARESATAIARRLALPPEAVFAAMREAPLRDLIAEFEADEARTESAFARAALAAIIKTADDPIERRRAATSLLRFFRSPIVSTDPRPSGSDKRRDREGALVLTAHRAATSSHCPQHDPADALDDSEDDELDGAWADDDTGPRTQDPGPAPDLSAAVAALAPVLESFRLGTVEMAAHALFERMSTAWRRSHGTAEKCARNIGPRTYLAPLHNHEHLELGPARWNPRERQAEIPLTITAPTRAVFTAHLSIEPDRGWVINGFDPRRSDSS